MGVGGLSACRALHDANKFRKKLKPYSYLGPNSYQLYFFGLLSIIILSCSRSFSILSGIVITVITGAPTYIRVQETLNPNPKP